MQMCLIILNIYLKKQTVYCTPHCDNTNCTFSEEIWLSNNDKTKYFTLEAYKEREKKCALGVANMLLL